jgi:hypothetical protein
MNYKLNTSAGDSFSTVSEKAKQIATEKNVTVEFDFNGIICLVYKNTNLDRLYRDYSNSWTMDWKSVGPNCLPFYEPEVQAEFERRTKLNEGKRAKQEAEYRAKEEKERTVFEEKVKGIEIELKDTEAWQKSREANTDPYGKCCIDYAEGWAKLMQLEMSKGKTLAECAESTSYELGFYGVTGFMYGAAVSTLAHCWKHGEDLRKWHNKEYNHEGEGVVNPAILTIG